MAVYDVVLDLFDRNVSNPRKRAKRATIVVVVVIVISGYQLTLALSRAKYEPKKSFFASL